MSANGTDTDQNRGIPWKLFLYIYIGHFLGIRLHEKCVREWGSYSLQQGNPLEFFINENNVFHFIVSLMRKFSIS